MARWTIGSYSRFVSHSMKEYGLTRDQAQQHYRAVADWKGAPAFASDLKNHPRVSERTATSIKEITGKLPPPGELIEPEEIEEAIEAEYEEDESAEYEGAFDSP